MCVRACVCVCVCVCAARVGVGVYVHASVCAWFYGDENRPLGWKLCWRWLIAIIGVVSSPKYIRMMLIFL